MEVGIIVLWFGAIGAIPSGFALCDGNNGTPDLRDRFVPGAGTTYNPGDNGGAVNHTHAFTTNGHTHGTEATPAFNVKITSPDGRISTNTDSGTTQPGSSLPPYHALAYIMRI